jgi:hypothetical protein
LKAAISNHGALATFQLMWEISYKHCLGGGSLISVLKWKILGSKAAAKVFQVNHIYKHTEEKDAILFSKLQHPNGMQLKG